MAAPCANVESVTGLLKERLLKCGFEVYPLKVLWRSFLLMCSFDSTKLFAVLMPFFNEYLLVYLVSGSEKLKKPVTCVKVPNYHKPAFTFS